MPAIIQGKLEGLGDVVKALGRLGKASTRNKVKRAALGKATKPVVDAVKANAPRESGLLGKSIGKKLKTYKDVVVIIIGPRTGWKRQVMVNGRPRFRNPAKYAHLVEKGAKGHQITLPSGRVVSHPGTPATHFLERAFDATKAKAEQILRAEVFARVEQEWLKK